MRVLLVAPNISTRMGGEAFKALMIARELHAKELIVRQVTHARVRDEISRAFPELDVVYVEDGPLQIFLHRLRLSPLLSLLNAWQLNRAARAALLDFPADVVHFTSPISPVLPYVRLTGTPVVIGPLNGNVSHPPAFRFREPRSKRLGKWLLRPTQAILGALFPAKRSALLLVSGGTRTALALQLNGCSAERLVPTLDSGVAPEIAGRPRIEHVGTNYRFVFLGRLVRYKAADLAIHALSRANSCCTLDIIGCGTEEPALRRLAESLGVADRVCFVGWVEPGQPLYERLAQYRALVFPTLAEANGIVVQEAMMLGLPIIALDWAGPAELLSGLEAMLIPPDSEASVVQGVARAMDALALEPALANRIARAGRDRASTAFGWGKLLEQWEAVYGRAIEESRASLER